MVKPTVNEFISVKSVVAIMFLDNLILTSSQFKCFVLFGQKRSFAANKKVIRFNLICLDNLAKHNAVCKFLAGAEH